MRVREQCLCFDNWIVVVVNHVISDVPRCVRHDAEYFVLNYLNLFHVGSGSGSPYGRSCNSPLDTLRENCGIIRKQASTDGGVLWEVMRVHCTSTVKEQVPAGCQKSKIQSQRKDILSRSVSSPKRGKFPKNTPYHDVFMGTLPSSRRGNASPFSVGCPRLDGRETNRLGRRHLTEVVRGLVLFESRSIIA
ncbi:hypothetical protein TNCV_713931 [Trichonephila clavipes]|nr:hypothetical protein TNCV_713931 [Trichonephila clavipes]